MRRNPDRELAKRQIRRLKAKESSQRAPRSVSDFALLGRWIFGVGAVVLISLVLAAYFTPMLAITNLQVVGTNRVTTQEIEARLKPILGESLTQVSEQQVAGLLAEFELIDTVSLESRPPHTLLVRIQEREPLVMLRVSGEYQLFDAAGVKIAQATDQDALPRLIDVGNPKSSAKFEPAIAILLEMPQRLFQDLESLRFDGDSALIRIRGYDFDVIWGTKSEAALKTEVLLSILNSLEKRPDVVDVSSPLAPVVRY